jgi:nickel-dependent lactate racemase
LKILTGDVQLHFFAGYGGGRKSILPGISSMETVKKNHSMVLQPTAKTGVLEGNPIHADMVEAAKLAEVDFILNIVANGNGEIVKAFAGDLEQAFYEGTKLVDEIYKVPVEGRMKIVLVSAGGYPHDLDLYNAYKALDSALNVVKKGGVVILVAECPEGHGHEVFYEWMIKFKDPESMEKELKKNFILGGHKAYFLKKALQKVKIILVSIMPDYYVMNTFGLRATRAVNDALQEAFEVAGKNSRVWVMPHGNTTLPIVKAAE